MGAVLNRFWWGGDPDVTDEETGLSRRDIYHVQRSWSLVYQKADKYGMQLFLALFRTDPATQSYFKTIKGMSEDQIRSSYQFKAHVLNLMSAINTAVLNIHEPKTIVALMNKLGETHKRHHIEVRHFDEVKIILVNILKNELAATDTVIASWGSLRCVFIQTHIFKIM
ncbi:hypothetical protein ACJJTC_003817 [Scirpophaga incertulas]